ncbi:hypothetical protein RCL_jg29025.t1 [Rhizophagus clarus]|uniref:Uncharacterized protein n=1 Tax=Rhizophagus clarus TaxID=94130 RepID=A0A8H3M4U0_9GLOM|nr:hypothetical protein RCL_jg29025.t1 [Rhizophagus clarus]
MVFLKRNMKTMDHINIFPPDLDVENNDYVEVRMVPQISNCGIIAIYGIAEHCGFLNLNIRNSAIRNCPQFRKYSAIPQSTAIQLRNNCGIAAHLRNCDTFAELQFR